MFRHPDDLVAAEAAQKLDRAAAVRRSIIRREPTVRPNRQRSSRTPVADSNSSRSRPRSHSPLWHERFISRTLDLEEPDQDADRAIAQLEEELEWRRATRLRARARRDRQTSGRTQDQLRRTDNLLRESHDTTQSPSSSDSLSESQTSFLARLPRPPRESSLRFQVDAADDNPSSQQPVLSTLLGLSRPQIPTPPDSTHDHSRSLSNPARVNVDNPLTSESTSRAIVEYGISSDMPGYETPPPETWESSYPPLRRVPHLSPRPPGSAGPRVDGLGDRRRSPSPLSENDEEQTWATLMHTMSHHLPIGTTGSDSTVTSFLSSRSNSAQRSNRSSQNTSTSFGEIGQLEDSCDLDLPQGITEDDVREIRARHRPTQGLFSRGGGLNSFWNRNVPDGPIMTGAQGLREHEARVERRREHERNLGGSRESEMILFQTLLERLQRQEHIPDDWWAAIGVSSEVMRGNP